MNKLTTTVTIKGQVTVPAAIRRKLGIHTSDTLHIREERGKIILEKDDYWSEFERLQEKVQKHRKKKGITPLTDAEIDALRSDAWSNPVS